MEANNLKITRVEEGHSEDYYLITFEGGKAEVKRDWDENTGYLNSLELEGETIMTFDEQFDVFEDINLYQLMVETARFENLEGVEGIEYVYNF